MKTYSITPKGQVTIPISIREALNIKPGDKIFYEETIHGVVIKPVKQNMINDYGFLKDHPKTTNDIETIRNEARLRIANRRQPS